MLVIQYEVLSQNPEHRWVCGHLLAALTKRAQDTALWASAEWGMLDCLSLFSTLQAYNSTRLPTTS